MTFMHKVSRCAGWLVLSWVLASCGGGGPAAEHSPYQDDGMVAGLLAAPVSEAQAVRFLWKSSFGPTTESIQRLRQLGYARFVDEQLALPSGRYNDFMLTPFTLGEVDIYGAYCAQFASANRDRCSGWVGGHNRAPAIVFLKSAVHDADQLRLRVAWALSQVLVVSSANPDVRLSYAMRIYQQLLRDQALGTYGQLLLRVSKNPLMGDFLDLAGSDVSSPNQNYARELLQLFSVGTYQRQPDGQFARNAQGQRIENYTPQQVADFSRALTGWVYAGQPHYEREMVATASRHDTGTKVLLNGQTIATGQSAQAELEAVIDNVMAHPSTGPHIVRQLIQFLVTSNPSPAYVARVVRVWQSNAAGVRGDLKSVVRAILLDSEALTPPDNAGRLLEPVLAMAGLVRAIGGSTDGAYLEASVAAMQQRPFAAPSVFNFYAPDQALPLAGRALQAPQFGIVSTATAVARLNAAEGLIFRTSISPDTDLPAGVRNGTALQWPAAWVQLAVNQVPALVDQINLRLTAGTLEPAVRNAIVAQVQALPGNNAQQHLQRVQFAAFLAFSSPQFMAHR